MASITLTKVNKHYGALHHAVKDVDLQIADQEFVALVGPSGCGKSTTLRMIAGLEDITDGEIRIGDRVVNHLPPRDRDVAMVFQNYALYQHMSVYDNLAFGLRNKKVPEAEIKAAIVLDKVNKHYGSLHHAVKDVDLEIADREFVALVGPSGCGKSTTLRMIAGLEDISSGEIRIGERVVNHLPPRDRDVAMVFQNYALYQHMSVYDNLAFGLRNKRVGEAEIKRAVDRLADLGLRRAPVAQAEGEVVVHAHVLIERVVLEHHGDVAVARRQVIDQAIADADLAAAHVLEARDHAQGGRLAAARRADQHDELAVADRDVDAVHDLELAERLADAADLDLCHAPAPPVCVRSILEARAFRQSGPSFI